MGRRMAARLAGLGDGPVAVHTRSREKLAGSLGPGLAWCDSPREVGEQADQVFLMLPTADATLDALEGARGLSAGPGTIVVNSATVGPEAAAAIGRRVAGAGGDYLDAPVLGSTAAAEQGQLVFLVGGAEATLQRCRPALERLGRRILHLGDVGRGSAAKLVFNAQLGAGMAALADTLRLAAVLGIPRSFILEEVLPAPVTAPALAAKRAALTTEAFDPQFPLRWMLKDLALAEASAARAGIRLPVLEGALARFRDAAVAGLGELDFAAVARPEPRP